MKFLLRPGGSQKQENNKLACVGTNSKFDCSWAILTLHQDCKNSIFCSDFVCSTYCQNNSYSVCLVKFLCTLTIPFELTMKATNFLMALKQVTELNGETGLIEILSAMTAQQEKDCQIKLEGQEI